MHKRKFGFLIGTLLVAILVSGCQKATKKTSGIQVVTSLDFYGEAAQKVLGQHGHVTALINSPSLDPHAYDPTTNDAKQVAKADVVIENGLGYDAWLNKMVASSPKKTGNLITISQLMKRHEGDNEHLWYDLKTMPKLTQRLVHQFSKIDPQHKTDYAKNGAAYIRQLTQLQQTAAAIKQTVKHDQVAVSEPVFDYALETMGYQIANQHFAKAIEDGTDPSPKDVTHLRKLLTQHEIQFLVVNKQEESSVIKQMHQLADKEGVPVVQVTETLPAKQNYLTWMKQQLEAVREAQEK